jgi:hypothetical protein
MKSPSGSHRDFSHCARGWTPKRVVGDDWWLLDIWSGPGGENHSLWPFLAARQRVEPRSGTLRSCRLIVQIMSLNEILIRRLANEEITTIMRQSLTELISLSVSLYMPWPKKGLYLVNLSRVIFHLPSPSRAPSLGVFSFFWETSRASPEKWFII